MKPFRSIAWRLQFWYAVLLTCLSAAFAVTAYTAEHTLLVRSTDSELDRRIANLNRILRSRPAPPGRGPRSRQDDLPPPEDGGPPDSPPPPRGGPLNPRLRLPPTEEAAYGEDWYYSFWEEDKPDATVSTNAPKDLERPMEVTPRGLGPSHRDHGVYREAFVVLPTGAVILVGRNMTSELRRVRVFGLLMAGCGVGLVVLALSIGGLLVRRSLKPIEAIGSTASKIATGDLSQRIGTKDADSELGQLIETLNMTFARLESSFAQQARFTSDAAHELRTPVSVLLAQTQVALENSGLDPEGREALAACHRAAQRMRSVIESLLVLARHDAGQASLQRRRIDLSERAAEAVALVGPLASQKSIALQTDLAPAPVSADPDQIDRLIVNLVTNAIVHQPSGGRLWVATRPDGTRVVLTVRDQGPGIAPEHLPHLFERFYRGDASRSRSSGGTGLGLAIVKAIAEGHGGTVTAENLPGGGALFTVQLPVDAS